MAKEEEEPSALSPIRRRSSRRFQDVRQMRAMDKISQLLAHHVFVYAYWILHIFAFSNITRRNFQQWFAKPLTVPQHLHYFSSYLLSPYSYFVIFTSSQSSPFITAFVFFIFTVDLLVVLIFGALHLHHFYTLPSSLFLEVTNVLFIIRIAVLGECEEWTFDRWTLFFLAPFATVRVSTRQSLWSGEWNPVALVKRNVKAATSSSLIWGHNGCTSLKNHCCQGLTGKSGTLSARKGFHPWLPRPCCDSSRSEEGEEEEVTSRFGMLEKWAEKLPGFRKKKPWCGGTKSFCNQAEPLFIYAYIYIHIYTYIYILSSFTNAKQEMGKRVHP